MSKQQPKMPKHLSDDVRSVNVRHMIRFVSETWRSIPREHLQQSHGITSLSEYIKEVEYHLYQKYYILADKSEYNQRIIDVIFNTKHNGVYLFKTFDPDELTDMTSQQMGSSGSSGSSSNASTSTSNSNTTAIAAATTTSASTSAPSLPSLPFMARPYTPLEEEIKKASQSYATNANNNAKMDVSELATMVEEIDPELKAVMGKSEDDQMESIYECHRCVKNPLLRHKSRNVAYHTRQTRGGDEGMTVYCRCKNAGCGNTWRINN